MFKTSNDRTKSILQPRIHTFACPSCPSFVKTRDCLSDGKFCAFFPKTEEIDVTSKDREDYVFDGKRTSRRDKFR